MFTQLRQDIVRTGALLRRARDERFLERIERPRCADRVADVVARCNGVTLSRTTIQYGIETYRLDAVRATVRDPGENIPEPGIRDVELIISGPDFEWTINSVALFSSRRIRAFAALINSYSIPDTEVLAA